MTNYAEVFNSYYMLLMNIVLKYLTAIIYVTDEHCAQVFNSYYMLLMSIVLTYLTAIICY